MEIRQALLEASPRIEEAGRAFDNAAQQGDLSRVEARVVPGVADAEMTGVYTKGMVKRKDGRRVYNAILRSAPHQRCLFCGHQNAKTLDHVLPKDRFFDLVVTPDNLVPACRDCNSSKGNTAPTGPEDSPWHPYYDDLGELVWLEARVVAGEPPVLDYFIVPPEDWTDQLTMKVQGHFERLGLGELYSTEAAVELVEIRRELRGIHESGGGLDVQEHLSARAESVSERSVSSWRAAAYRAWANDELFCDGGFGQ